MILLIDNYDSFSYNLFQYVGEIEPDIKVVRNDELSVSEIIKLAPDRIIISPGPGRPEDAGPEDAGNIIEVAREAGKTIPTLGVCLGHQATCAAFGAKITYAKRLMHGKQSEVTVDAKCPLFVGLPEKVPVARYHSLAADESTLPDCLKTAARTDDGEIMAVQHSEYPIFGVQFHPESIMTPGTAQRIPDFRCPVPPRVDNDTRRKADVKEFYRRITQLRCVIQKAGLRPEPHGTTF